jgi:Flp pilus assembly protein TadG
MTTQPSSHRRARGDVGSILVEFALVVPVLLLMAFGITEFGLAWTASNRLEGAVSQATRVAASSGSRVETDHDALVALKSALDAEALANIDRVVIFKPSNADGAVPTGCIKAVNSTNETGQADCNSYSGATVRSVTAASLTGFGGGASAKDRYWAPATRKDTMLGPPDYVGVWVRTTHKSVTGTYWRDFTITKKSIYRIQPDFST